MHLVLLSFGFGLVTASLLALAAVGFTLQFSVTNILNSLPGHHDGRRAHCLRAVARDSRLCGSSFP